MTDDNINPKELGNDVIATVNQLMTAMKNNREARGEDQPSAMGMDPTEMVEMFKPQLYQKVQSQPERTLQSVAVLNQATTDILEKHSDESVSSLAAQGMEPQAEE